MAALESVTLRVGLDWDGPARDALVQDVVDRVITSLRPIEATVRPHLVIRQRIIEYLAHYLNPTTTFCDLQGNPLGESRVKGARDLARGLTDKLLTGDWAPQI
jgi:hypothetical protein